MIRRTLIVSMIVAGSLVLGTQMSRADCVTKGAEATSTTEKSAKWFALETMVQAVSWGLWPGFVATGNVAGYTVQDEKYVCTKGTGTVTCRGRATFCKTG